MHKERFFLFGLNFLSKLSAHPHDCWVGIINRMNLDVFQYKLLFIPSSQDNHKSLFVVTGLQNVVKNGHRLAIGDQPCILHLKLDNRQLNHSLTNVTAHIIRLMLNKLSRSHLKAGNDMTINPFSSRFMPIRSPTGKKLCQVDLYASILFYPLMIVHMCAFQYA